MMFLLKNNSILLIILTPKKASRVSVWQNGHYVFMRVRQKKTEVKVKVTQSCLTLCDPGQNTGVGSLSLLQGIFPTQKSNRGLPHCRWVLYQVSHQESPRILEWVAYPFCSGFHFPLGFSSHDHQPPGIHHPLKLWHKLEQNSTHPTHLLNTTITCRGFRCLS